MHRDRVLVEVAQYSTSSGIESLQRSDGLQLLDESQQFLLRKLPGAARVVHPAVQLQRFVEPPRFKMIARVLHAA